MLSKKSENIRVIKADRVRIMEDRVHYRILIFSKYKSLAKSNYISVFIALFIAYDQDIESLRLPAFFLIISAVSSEGTFFSCLLFSFGNPTTQLTLIL